MSKVTNKHIANAFALARARIENDGEEFICCALDFQNTEAGEAARMIIRDRLDSEYILNTWVWNNIPEARDIEKNMGKENYYKEMMKYRLRWLDALIKEFSNKR